MQSSVLLQKILQLEKELLELKSQFPAETRPKKIFNKTKWVVDGVLAYWIPLALIVGLGVNWWFGVGFFENIKNIGIQKKSSDYYLDIGNNLMSHAQFPAAADAFRKSLQINPNNIDATQGLMKAGVLQDMGNSRNPVVVEDILAYMRKKFGENDYILLYWEGILQRQLSGSTDDLKAAKSLFLRSIEQNPKFAGSHVELANTYLLEGDIDNAIVKFDEVVKFDHRFTDALSNLGYCRFILSHFETDERRRQQILRKAADDLENARSLSPVAETDLRLGDSYLFMNQYSAAEVAHQNALETLQRMQASKTPEPFEVLLLFPPTDQTEGHNVGPALLVNTTEELKSLTLFSLSLDRAALQDSKNAQKYFNDASALDPRHRFSPLIALQINSLLHLPSIARTTRTWLSAHINEVCRGVEGCMPPTLVRTSQKERKRK